MPKYIGATIGPIVDTLMKAKSTKQIWGASYLFSYLMKNIIKEIKDKEFLIPYVGEGEYLKEGNEAGLFHDRFIIKTKDVKKDFKHIINAKENVFKNLVNEATGLTLEYLNHYIKFNLVEVEVKEGENPIFKVSEYLDILELQPQLCQNQLFKDELMNYFDDAKVFYKDSFGNEKLKPKSLPEIAISDMLCEISQDDKNDILKNFNTGVKGDDEKAYKILSSYNDKFKKHHKYYSIMRADGDNIGKVIETIGEDKYQDFSKNLFIFSRKNVDLINEYGGLTIYAGGDDLLLFTPIVNGEKNIFTLMEEISKNFKECIEEKYNELLEKKGIEEKPSLSFGIDIRYYKDPMSKSLKESATMLFGKAKSYEGKYQEKNKSIKIEKDKKYEKNAVGLKLNKHSGTEIEFTIGKSNNLYEILKNMLNINYEAKLLKGVMYKLESQNLILKEIINKENMIDAFFDNNFKKEHHTDLEMIRGLFKECKLVEDIKIVISMLRFIAFMSEKGGE